MGEVSDFPGGTHAQIQGLVAKPELNDQYCVSRGVNPDNAERLNMLTRTGAIMSLRPSNLRRAELLPGTRVTVAGMEHAKQYDGSCGEVLSWEGSRWIVDLDAKGDDKKERKSFRSDNLVIIPAAVASKKRPAEEAEVDAKKLKTTDMKDLCCDDETKVARALVRTMREFPIVAQKCICCLATKQTVTVMHELAQHLTNKAGDGLLRRELRPGEKVRGIEELDPIEQCHIIAEKRVRALASMVRINYCDLLGFLKQGFKEPKFKQRQQ